MQNSRRLENTDSRTRIRGRLRVQQILDSGDPLHWSITSFRGLVEIGMPAPSPEKQFVVANMIDYFVNRRDCENDTRLMKAVKTNDLRYVKVLLTHRADINAQGGASGETALMLAAQAGRVDIVKTLLERGARTDIQDDEKKTALCHAKFSRIEYIIKQHFLLAKESRTAFLMGMHDRVGRESPIFIVLKNDYLADKKVVGMLFGFLSSLPLANSQQPAKEKVATPDKKPEANQKIKALTRMTEENKTDSPTTNKSEDKEQPAICAENLIKNNQEPKKVWENGESKLKPKKKLRS